jgi:hypothetical protein
VSRSCAPNCVDYATNGLSHRCCQTDLCNNFQLDHIIHNDIERCFVCDSLTNPDCFHGTKLGFADTQQCQSGTGYCMVMT